VPNWGRRIILIMMALMVSCASPPDITPPLADIMVPTMAPLETTLDTLQASNLSIAEKRGRSAAVKVRPPFLPGHGSGTYMRMYGEFVVVTAAHVVDEHTVMYIEERDNNTVIGRVIYKDDRSDIAVIHVPELKSRIAVPYRPKKNNINLIGASVSYTGFPGRHDLITIRGHVASLEHNMIVTHMFGWFGASGSGVFDQQGRFLGVVSAIDVGNIGIPIPLDSIVWVAPAWDLDEDLLRIRVKTVTPLETFNSFPGAAAPRRGGTRD
jgi:S1-C subfamily serine protease